MDDYKNKKQMGIISILSIIDEEITLQKKQFDPETGQEIEPKIDTYLKSSLLIKKGELERELQDVNDLLDEYDN